VSRSPDTSLRDWARERVTAVKAQVAKSGDGKGGSGAASPKPPAKPSGKKP
jgi:hypothetical protein